MASDSHSIKRVALDLTINNLSKRSEIEENLKKILYDEVLSFLQTELTKLTNGEERVQLDRIEVDLGEFNLDNYERGFTTKAKELLRQKLKKEITANRIDSNESFEEAIVSFLEKGFIPWWYSNDYKETNKLILARLKDKSSSFYDDLIKILNSNASVKRFIYQFDQEVVETFLLRLIPNFSQVEKLAEKFDKIFSKEFKSFKATDRNIFLIKVVTETIAGVKLPWVIAEFFKKEISNKLAKESLLNGKDTLTRLLKNEDSELAKLVLEEPILEKKKSGIEIDARDRILQNNLAFELIQSILEKFTIPQFAMGYSRAEFIQYFDRALNEDQRVLDAMIIKALRDKTLLLMFKLLGTEESIRWITEASSTIGYLMTRIEKLAFSSNQFRKDPISINSEFKESLLSNSKIIGLRVSSQKEISETDIFFAIDEISPFEFAKYAVNDLGGITKQAKKFVESISSNPKDEIKLSEVFKRVHIPESKSSNLIEGNEPLLDVNSVGKNTLEHEISDESKIEVVESEVSKTQGKPQLLTQKLISELARYYLLKGELPWWVNSIKKELEGKFLFSNQSELQTQILKYLWLKKDNQFKKVLKIILKQQGVGKRVLERLNTEEIVYVAGLILPTYFSEDISRILNSLYEFLSKQGILNTKFNSSFVSNLLKLIIGNIDHNKPIDLKAVLSTLIGVITIQTNLSSSQFKELVDSNLTEVSEGLKLRRADWQALFDQAFISDEQYSLFKMKVAEGREGFFNEISGLTTNKESWFKLFVSFVTKESRGYQFTMAREEIEEAVLNFLEGNTEASNIILEEERHGRFDINRLESIFSTEFSNSISQILENDFVKPIVVVGEYKKIEIKQEFGKILSKLESFSSDSKRLEFLVAKVYEISTQSLNEVIGIETFQEMLGLLQEEIFIKAQEQPDNDFFRKNVQGLALDFQLRKAKENLLNNLRLAIRMLFQTNPILKAKFSVREILETVLDNLVPVNGTKYVLSKENYCKLIEGSLAQVIEQELSAMNKSVLKEGVVIDDTNLTEFRKEISEAYESKTLIKNGIVREIASLFKWVDKVFPQMDLKANQSINNIGLVISKVLSLSENSIESTRDKELLYRILKDKLKIENTTLENLLSVELSKQNFEFPVFDKNAFLPFNSEIDNLIQEVENRYFDAMSSNDWSVNEAVSNVFLWLTSSSKFINPSKSEKGLLLELAIEIVKGSLDLLSESKKSQIKNIDEPIKSPKKDENLSQEISESSNESIGLEDKSEDTEEGKLTKTSGNLIASDLSGENLDETKQVSSEILIESNEIERDAFIERLIDSIDVQNTKELENEISKDTEKDDSKNNSKQIEGESQISEEQKEEKGNELLEKMKKELFNATFEYFLKFRKVSWWSSYDSILDFERFFNKRKFYARKEIENSIRTFLGGEHGINSARFFLANKIQDNSLARNTFHLISSVSDVLRESENLKKMLSTSDGFKLLSTALKDPLIAISDVDEQQVFNIIMLNHISSGSLDFTIYLRQVEDGIKELDPAEMTIYNSEIEGYKELLSQFIKTFSSKEISRLTEVKLDSNESKSIINLLLDEGLLTLDGTSFTYLQQLLKTKQIKTKEELLIVLINFNQDNTNSEMLDKWLARINANDIGFSHEMKNVVNAFDVEQKLSLTHLKPKILLLELLSDNITSAKIQPNELELLFSLVDSQEATWSQSEKLIFLYRQTLILAESKIGESKISLESEEIIRKYLALPALKTDSYLYLSDDEKIDILHTLSINKADDYLIDLKEMNVSQKKMIEEGTEEFVTSLLLKEALNSETFITDLEVSDFEQLSHLIDPEKVEITQENHDWLEVSDGDRIYVSNAGLIILWPFFGRLFKNLGITEAGKFVDDEAREKAVHLLQYIVDFEEDIPEQFLVLNKIICGIEIKQVVRKKVGLTKNEKNEVKAFLEAIKSQWKEMKNTKLGTFQDSFLKRDGILEYKNGKWFLKVDHKPIDILLTNLPWGLSVVKFAWSKSVIFVEWKATN